MMKKEKEQLLHRLAEDIRLRGLSENTFKSYTKSVDIFLSYSIKSVEQLDETDIRNFLLYLIDVKRVSPVTANNYSAAIRFLFAVTLNRTLNYLQIPRFKKRKKLPEVLTREEVVAIIDSCDNIKHKAMLSLMYGSGLRVSEAASIKTHHIDSKNMRLFVEDGKGGKDRYTVLSETCLKTLRKYWKEYRPKHCENWLFLGTYKITHITSDAFAYAFNNAVKRAGITKDNISSHSLRHAFATHLLEDGATLLEIKELLGHSSIQSTTIYLHMADLAAGVKSPLDRSEVCTDGKELRDD